MMRVAGGPLPDGINDRVPSGEFDLTEKPTATHAEDAPPEEGVVLFPASHANLCDVQRDIALRVVVQPSQNAREFHLLVGVQ